MKEEKVLRLIVGDFLLLRFDHIQVDFMLSTIAFNFIIHSLFLSAYLIILASDIHGLIVSYFVGIYPFTCLQVYHDQGITCSIGYGIG